MLSSASLGSRACLGDSTTNVSGKQLRQHQILVAMTTGACATYVNQNRIITKRHFEQNIPHSGSSWTQLTDKTVLTTSLHGIDKQQP